MSVVVATSPRGVADIIKCHLLPPEKESRKADAMALGVHSTGRQDESVIYWDKGQWGLQK
jgi:hypothetical protein